MVCTNWTVGSGDLQSGESVSKPALERIVQRPFHAVLLMLYWVQDLAVQGRPNQLVQTVVSMIVRTVMTQSETHITNGAW